MRRAAVAAAALALVAAPAASAAPRAPSASELSPRIDNPYLPLRPGSTWVYQEGRERIVVRALRRTKRIANGVTARVVRDTVTERGRLVEDTFDWYAQDRRGNVWYLGEDTKEYEDGEVVSTEGSWEAGVGGARAGIAMLARPRPGRAYRQENLPGEAEDRARVLSVDEQASTPAGHFRRVLLTRDWNPLEPRVLEYKLYARGVGLVAAIGVSGEIKREELVRYRR